MARVPSNNTQTQAAAPAATMTTDAPAATTGAQTQPTADTAAAPEQNAPPIDQKPAQDAPDEDTGRNEGGEDKNDQEPVSARGTYHAAEAALSELPSHPTLTGAKLVDRPITVGADG